MPRWRNWHTQRLQNPLAPGSNPGRGTRFHQYRPCSPTGRGIRFRSGAVKVRILPGPPCGSYRVARKRAVTPRLDEHRWFDSSTTHHFDNVGRQLLPLRACSSNGSERAASTRQVGGSTPPTLAKSCPCGPTVKGTGLRTREVLVRVRLGVPVSCAGCRGRPTWHVNRAAKRRWMLARGGAARRNPGYRSRLCGEP